MDTGEIMIEIELSKALIGGILFAVAVVSFGVLFLGFCLKKYWELALVTFICGIVLCSWFLFDPNFGIQVFNITLVSL